MLENIDKTKRYNVTFKIRRKDVKIIGESENAIKVLPFGSLDENRTAHINKNCIIDIEEIKENASATNTNDGNTNAPSL